MGPDVATSHFARSRSFSEAGSSEAVAPVLLFRFNLNFLS
jgi:hypothetical protein